MSSHTLLVAARKGMRHFLTAIELIKQPAKDEWRLSALARLVLENPELKDAYTALLGSLRLGANGNRRRSILITGTQPNEGKTLAAFTRQFGMTWPQVYDGGFWKAEIAKLYAIDSIPHAILVNGDTGKILAILNGSEEIRSGLEPAVAQAVTMLHTSAARRDR